MLTAGLIREAAPLSSFTSAGGKEMQLFPSPQPRCSQGSEDGPRFPLLSRLTRIMCWASRCLPLKQPSLTPHWSQPSLLWALSAEKLWHTCRLDIADPLSDVRSCLKARTKADSFLSPVPSSGAPCPVIKLVAPIYSRIATDQVLG